MPQTGLRATALSNNIPIPSDFTLFMQPLYRIPTCVLSYYLKSPTCLDLTTLFTYREANRNDYAEKCKYEIFFWVYLFLDLFTI